MSEQAILVLQQQQHAIIERIYEATGRFSANEALLKTLNDAYDETVSAIQALHPLGKDCPAYICDGTLYQHYSDFHKEVYGCRYRGDATPAELDAMLKRLHIENERQFEAERERMLALDEQVAEESRVRAEEAATAAAYDVRYDHHDPRIAA